MLFLVNLTSGRGTYVLGFVKKQNISEAQKYVFEILKQYMPEHKIALQVTDHSEIIISTSILKLVHIPKLDEKSTKLISTLLS